MASQTLTNKTVASTYQGVLHANGEPLPSSSVATVFDGSGQTSALSLGLSGNGAAIAGGLSCTGQLTAGEIRYTTVDSVSGANYPLVSDGRKNAVFGQMTSNALLDLSPSPAGSYGNIQFLSVNSKGLITNVVGGPATSNAWATFDGRDVAFTYTINNLVVTCSSLAHTLAAGNTITIKNATNSSLNGTFVVQSSTAGAFTFANPTGATSGSGSGVVDVAIKSSYNVSSIVRESTGVYRINFSESFKNTDYVTLCNAKYPNTAITDLENLQANTVSTEKEYVRVRSFYLTSGNLVTEYDDGYVSVYCLGSTVDTINPTPISFDNFINTNYFWTEGVFPGNITTSISVTPQLMATNKWNAIIIGAVVPQFICRGGCEYVSSVAVVNGTTTSQLAQSTCGETYASVYLYHVLYYSDNKLKYANFYYSNYGWSTSITNAWDKLDSAAASSIYSGLASQGAIIAGQEANKNQSSPGTWFINFLNQYQSTFIEIQSVDISVYSTAAQGGACYGGYTMSQNYVRYFTP
jgi:hypothetical protein